MIKPIGYIAAPYRADTEAEVAANIMRAQEAEDLLASHGIQVMVPHTQSLLLDPCNERGDDWWLAYTRAMAKRSQFLVRLEGQSEGADEEVRDAMLDGRLVFDGVQDCIDCMAGTDGLYEVFEVDTPEDAIRISAPTVTQAKQRYLTATKQSHDSFMSLRTRRVG